MTDIEKYKIFLIEQYRAKSGLTAGSVYNMFKERGIFEYIDQTFDALHTIDTAEVLADIESLV